MDNVIVNFHFETAGQGIAIPGFHTLTVPAGQDEVAVDFLDPIENEEKYYLSYAIILKDGGKYWRHQSMSLQSAVLQGSH